MPDYGFTYKGYKLYFTMKCVVEPMHAHVEKEYIQSKAAKIWIGENGESKIQSPGQVPERILKEMQDWIKDNHESMEQKWNAYGGGGFYVAIEKNIIIVKAEPRLRLFDFIPKVRFCFC